MNRTVGLIALVALGLSACSPKAEEPKPAAEATPAGSKEAADVMASLGAAGGGASNPQMTAFTTNFDKVVNSIVTIKDEASAKSVGAQLQPVYAEMETQAKAIDALPESEKSAAAMAAAPKFMAGAMKVAQHMMTLSPELQEIVGKELDKMPSPPEPK